MRQEQKIRTQEQILHKNTRTQEEQKTQGNEQKSSATKTKPNVEDFLACKNIKEEGGGGTERKRQQAEK